MSERDDSMDEVVREFLVESSENLDQLDRDLVSLERDPSSRELLASVFRAVHTIKGTTGFLGFNRLEEVAHRAESLLSKLRDGALKLDSARTTVLLEVIDTIRALLAHIEANGNDEDGRDHGDLLARLTALLGPEAPRPAPALTGPALAAPTSVSAPAVSTTTATPPPGPAPLAPSTAAPAAATARAERASPAAAVVRPVASALPGALDGLGVSSKSPPRARGRKPATTPGDGPSLGTPEEPSTGREQGPATVPGPARLAGPDAWTDEVLAPAAETPEDSAPAVPGSQLLLAAERSVRVDVDLLDTLMRQVGELVLARNQLISHAGELADGGRTLQRLSLIVSELQEDVMKTRMQPVEQLWSKLPRVVRDLASQFSKEVALSLEGGETELDRSMLEAVKDPFTHLVRNAIDHGIEAPDVRQSAGKARAGSLRLSAFHQGGQVVLEMTDDGAGIDPQRIGAKALQLGLVTAERLAKMSTREVTDLVFQPGFSTAKEVSNVSGRGVGMDVVRTNIERIGGTVDLSSVPGAGTTVRIKIPLTLAIIPALLVACRGSSYAVPQAAVRELVRLEGSALAHQVEQVDGALVYRLRGRLLPLLCLDEVLGHEPVPFCSRESLDIVVVLADGVPFGLAVDAVEGTQEIVVKPLARHLKGIAAYAGATILGDGSVALILDVAGLAEPAGVTEGRAAAMQPEGGLVASSSRTETLLILRVDDRRLAVPLSQVARLEEVDADQVEHAGRRRAVQYRGELLPLAWATEVLGLPAGPVDGRLPVVVCTDGNKSVGLVAEEILDVVEQVLNVSDTGAVPGILGTAVVQGRATDLLDLLVVAQGAGIAFRPTVDLALGAAPAQEEVGAHAR